MKTQTTKRATRRLAASIAIATALATSATLPTWAADINWRTDRTGGTEAAPLDLYESTNWNPSGTPTSSDDLTISLASGSPTVLTNTLANADTTTLANKLYLDSGDFTFLGGLRISSDMDVPHSGSGSISIAKKGNWDLGRGVYFGSTQGSFCAFTNVSGKIEHTNSDKWFEIGNNGTCVFENLAGDWTIAGYFVVGNSNNGHGELYWRGGNLRHTNTEKPFNLARSGGAYALVEKYTGDWTISNYLVMSEGNSSSATFKHLGGTMKVDGSDIRLVDNASNSSGGADFELGGGTVEAKLIQHGAGSAPATFKFDGGTLKAAAAGTLVAASDYLTVNATANGGTIDANGKVVEIEEPIADASGETGKMTFVGGGSVTLSAAPTYTGATTVEVGTTLVSPAAPAGILAFTLPDGGLTKGIYEVVRLEGGTFADNVLAGALLPSDPRASFRLNAVKTAILCFYEISEENCVARWDFNDTANPMAATIGGDATQVGTVTTVTTGLESGNSAVSIPTGSHLALPVPDAVKNHAWIMKIRFYSPNAGIWRSFFNRDNTTDGDLFINKSDKLGGGKFKGTGNNETSVSAETWHTLTISAEASGYEISLDGTLAIYDTYDRTDFFCDSNEALADIGGVGHLLLCADNNSEDGLLYIDYVEFDSPRPANAKVWVGMAGNGNMNDGDNWLDGAAPAAGALLDFTEVSSATTLNANFGDGRVFSTAVFGEGVVTVGTGTLNVSTLTNATKLAVASGAKLAVEGDLVAMPVAESDTKTFLYSNEGTVTVGGKALAYSKYDNASVYEYEEVSDNTQPIKANGLAYNCDGSPAKLYFHLSAKDHKAGAWVVGADGMTFQSSRQAWYSTFYTEKSGSVVLNSAADWVLANSGKNSSYRGDIWINKNGSVTLNTSDYSDNSVARTVTLNGRIFADNVTSGSAVVIDGCGTVVVNTTGSNSGLGEDLQHTCLSNSVMQVNSGATLKINAGKKITGDGTVSLAAGTTLALDSSALGAIGDTEFTPCIPSLALPATGTATLCIDGAKLRAGDYVLLDSVPENYENLTVDRTATAIDGRKASVVEKDGKLVLNIVPDGLIIIFR